MRINEVNMAPAKLKKEALTTTVKVGIEFELINNVIHVETTPDYDDEPYVEIDYTQYERDTARDSGGIEDILNNYTYGFRNSFKLSIISDFDNWIHDKKQEIFERTIANVEDFVEYAIGNNHYSKDDYDSEEDMVDAIRYDYKNETRYYDDIKNEIVDDINDDLAPGYWWSEYFREYMNESDFPVEYRITYPDSGSMVSAVEDIMSDYQHFNDNWAIEEDGSLGDRGIEIITQPIPVQDMENIIRTFTDFVKSHDFETNESCGLHMNMSYDNFNIKNLNYLKLACLMGDKHILKKFDRLNNHFAPPSSERLETYAKKFLYHFKSLEQAAIINDPNKVFDMIIQGSSLKNKYNSIGIKNNRIEFRGPGGNWLNWNEGTRSTTVQTVIDTMYRLAAIIQACSPENDQLYKKDYLKKVYKLLTDNGQDPIIGKIVASYITGDITKEKAVSLLSHSGAPHNKVK